MTTNIFQNFQGYKNKKGLHSIELTNHEKFVNGSADIFDLLDKTERAAPSVSEMESLLRDAYKMIKQSQETISNQSQRINKLENMLMTDEMTGLYNRHGFFENFKREIDRTNRGQSKGGLLIMIDLDNFKSINDTYGHQAGDAALKLVGAFLAGEIREMDLAARLGGDEFILLFPNTNQEKAMRRAQMMGVRLNNLSMIWQNTEIQIGASLGLKDYSHGDTIESIISHADNNMYSNKKTKKKALQ